MTERKEATKKVKVTTKEDCFIDGCYKAEGTCKGIPGSNRCAACRLRKNALGLRWGM